MNQCCTLLVFGLILIILINLVFGLILGASFAKISLFFLLLMLFWTLVHTQPVGVIGAITPWNIPLAMITRKVC